MFSDDDDDPHPKGNLSLHQANEVTFLAWTRTIVALLAFGCIIGEFAIFRDEVGAAERAAPYLGSLVVLTTGVIALGFAISAYRRRYRAIEHGDRMRRRTRLLYVYAALIGVTALVLALQLFNDVKKVPTPHTSAPARVATPR